MDKKSFAEKCREAGINPKQLIVALIILLAAIIVLSLSFCSKQPEPVSQPVVKEAVIEEQPVVEENVTDETSDVSEEAPADDEEKIVVEEAPVAEVEPEAVEEEPVVVEAEPTNVVLTFTATAEKEFQFQIYYTAQGDIWFDEEHTLTEPAKIGTHKYNISIPEESIYLVRIDFGERPGKVNIKDIYLTGTQKVDLNDFSQYELHQIEPVVEETEDTETNENSSKALVIDPKVGLSFFADDTDPYIAYRPRLRN